MELTHGGAVDSGDGAWCRATAQRRLDLQHIELARGLRDVEALAAVLGLEIGEQAGCDRQGEHFAHASLLDDASDQLAPQRFGAVRFSAHPMLQSPSTTPP